MTNNETDYKTIPEHQLAGVCGTDASKWAKAFTQLHGGDEGLMLGWFANAIETARDTPLGEL